jgi:hypothetical protein
LAERIAEWQEHQPALSSAGVTREERVGHLSRFVAAVREQLASESDTPTEEQLRIAREYGKARKNRGYTAAMLLMESQAVEAAVTDLVRKDLMSVPIAGLFYDIVRLHKIAAALTLAALEAYDGAELRPRKKSKRESVGTE